MTTSPEDTNKKRKRQAVAEIEIDLSAPEPPSKKALRKAKKKGANVPSTATTEPEVSTDVKDQEDLPSPTAEKNQRSDYGIWIGNLAFSISKDDVRKFLTSNCSFTDATITRIHMPKGPMKNGISQNKGYAYVDFSTKKALLEALALSEQLLLGRRVLIKDAKNFEGRPEKPQQEGQAAHAATNSGKPPSKRIFVGNLGFDATKEIVEEHFGQCGTVTNVHVATFQDSGKCKGYAWVEFEDLAAAETAVRGYIMAKEEDEEDDAAPEEGTADSDSEKRKPTKNRKPRQKKIWVNTLLGRRMRMEFAEDPTTRYKKRFGKDGEGKKTDGSDFPIVEDGHDESNSRTTGEQKPRKAKRTVEEVDSRYSKETVQRLSGAIVEAQGKKTTFD